MRKLNYQAVESAIVNWLTDYSNNAGTNGFVIGVSGGVDSAVASTLCAKTGLPLIVVEMPIHQGKDQVDRAVNHINWLKENFTNVESKKIDLTSTFDFFKGATESAGVIDVDKLAEANSRARLRMTTLYHVAALTKSLVCGTGNKVEDFGVGFYTKYGDGGVDLSPIADLYKSEVRGLAAHMGVAQEIVTAAPTDGLWDDGRTDEDQIGATYDELEWAMEYINNNHNDIMLGVHPYNDCTDRQKKVMSIYLDFHKRNKHKMEGIPVFTLDSAYIAGYEEETSNPLIV